MNKQFSDKFGVITRTLAKDLYIMNQKRIGFVPYDEFVSVYQTVVNDFNELKALMMTIPSNELDKPCMKTYLVGLSAYLPRYIKSEQESQREYNFSNIEFDVYKKSVDIYREMVRSGGRNHGLYS